MKSVEQSSEILNTTQVPKIRLDGSGNTYKQLAIIRYLVASALLSVCSPASAQENTPQTQPEFYYAGMDKNCDGMIQDSYATGTKATAPVTPPAVPAGNKNWIKIIELVTAGGLALWLRRIRKKRETLLETPTLGKAIHTPWESLD